MGEPRIEFQNRLAVIDGDPFDPISDAEQEFGCMALGSVAQARGDAAVTADCEVKGDPAAVSEVYAEAGARLSRLVQSTTGACFVCDFGRNDSPVRKGRLDIYELRSRRSACAQLPATLEELAGLWQLEDSFSLLMRSRGMKVEVERVSENEEDVVMQLETSAGAYDALVEMKGVVICQIPNDIMLSFTTDDGQGSSITVRRSIFDLLAAVAGRPGKAERYRKDCPALEDMTRSIEIKEGQMKIKMKSGKTISFDSAAVIKFLDQAPK